MKLDRNLQNFGANYKDAYDRPMLNITLDYSDF